jgi:ABC-type methionine transport system permease subunit
MIGRGWLLGIILIAMGLIAGNDVGLSAAVLAILLFTVSFTFKLVTRAFDGPPPGSKASS